MAHKFDPGHVDKLHSSERYRLLDPEKLLGDLGIQPGQVVADLGCGSGFFTIPLAKLVGAKGTVYAVDISEEMLTRLREQHPPEQVEIRQATENHIPLPTNSVDWVLLTFVYHELENRRRYLFEIRRILRENGKLWLLEWIPRNEEMGPPVQHRVAREQAVAELQEAGFRVLRSRDVNPSHYEVLAERTSIRCGC
jgi:ubiquinone/menaquinone biosynthesis C-methylase UbiE